MTVAKLARKDKTIEAVLLNIEYSGTTTPEEVRDAIRTIHSFLANIETDSMSAMMDIDQLKRVLYWLNDSIEPFALRIERS